MGRYVPRSGWAEQKNFTRKLLRKNSNPSHLSSRVSTSEKLSFCAQDASDKTAKQNESDDHFRLADIRELSRSGSNRFPLSRLSPVSNGAQPHAADQRASRIDHPPIESKAAAS